MAAKKRARKKARKEPGRRRLSINELIPRIVTTQGNRFVKELLREIGEPIGNRKTDFKRNLTEAVQSGALTSQVFEEWLGRTEGWGNQHVYLYNVPPSLNREITPQKILKNVKASKRTKYWNATASYAFPDERQLTSISCSTELLSVTWHEGSKIWLRDSDEDFQRDLGLDLYEWRAYRRLERRAVTRFEMRRKLGLAALFIPDPVSTDEHDEARQDAADVVNDLLAWKKLSNARVNIGDVAKRMDQATVGTRPSPRFETQRSRLSSAGAYVEFGSRGSGSYAASPAIRAVRAAVRSQQLRLFTGTGGLFEFQATALPTLGRNVKVELFGTAKRIKFRALMDRDEVWTILDTLSQYQ